MRKDSAGASMAGLAEQDHGQPIVDASVQRRRVWLRIFAMAFSALLLLLSGVIVTRVLLTTDYHALRLAIRDTSLEQFAVAGLFTALSYLALTGYDAVAVRQLRLKVSYATTALASFTSFAISFTLGFPLVTAGTVRYWIYSQVGVRAGAVATLTLISGTTFYFGMVLAIGVAFVLRPQQMASINQLSPWLNVLIGLGAVAIIAMYIYWVSVGRRRLSVRGMFLELPGFRLTVGQVCLGTIDLVCAAAALYVLLPVGHGLDFTTFVAIYVFACLLGIASHAPGGIGVFEVTILKMVPAPSTEGLLAALLLFRAIYYLIPFVLAFALLGAHEGMRRWKSLRAEMSGPGQS